MGIVCLDPRNLEGDLQSGAIVGYSLLQLLMWATTIGRHLSELCREEYPPCARIVLWLMTEVALIGANIQGVLGRAIAISFIFLFLENYGVRKLEAFFAVLIGVMVLSFDWMFGEAKPNGVDVLFAILVPKLSPRNIQQAVGVVVALLCLTMCTCILRLFDQGRAIPFGEVWGGPFPILCIWGIGLLTASQSSTIIGTCAGQFIMEGFLNLRLTKWMRALITQSFATIPTMIVPLIFDTLEESLDVMNEWLNVLQSVQVPFALVSLLCLVSKEQIMASFNTTILCLV